MTTPEASSPDAWSSPRHPAPITGKLVDDVADLARHEAEWDDLAAAAGRPYCAPAWMLAWWRRCAPESARLRVAVALEGDRLAGIAPMFAERGRAGLVRYRMLGAGSAAPLTPLALTGREREVTAAIAHALAAAEPSPGVLMFDEIPRDSPWPELLAEQWPRAASVERFGAQPAPFVELDADGFDEWMASKSSNFRGQVRKANRQLAALGATRRVSTGGEELTSDLASFYELHAARWSGRGESSVVQPGVETMLSEASEQLPEGRFRVYSIDVEGRPISSQVFVAAGDRMAYWNGGFDEEHAAQRPALMALVDAVQDAFSRGQRCLDLGPGAQDYKYRLAGETEPLEFARVMPAGKLNRARLAPERLRRNLSARLSPGQKAGVRRLLRRPPS